MSRSIKIVFMLIIAAYITSCASTAQNENSSKLKNIAVINYISNDFLIYKRKIPVSEIKFNISEWKLNEYLSNEVLSNLKLKNPEAKFELIAISGMVDAYSMIDSHMTNELKEKGFDGVIIINNAGVYNGEIEFIPREKGGFLMFVTYSLMGTEYKEILSQYGLSLYELSDGKLISYSAHSKNEYKFVNEIKANEYKEYSIEDLKKIQLQLKASIDSSVGEVVDRLFK